MNVPAFFANAKTIYQTTIRAHMTTNRQNEEIYTKCKRQKKHYIDNWKTNDAGKFTIPKMSKMSAKQFSMCAKRATLFSRVTNRNWFEDKSISDSETIYGTHALSNLLFDAWFMRVFAYVATMSSAVWRRCACCLSSPSSFCHLQKNQHTHTHAHACMMTTNNDNVQFGFRPRQRRTKKLPMGKLGRKKEKTNCKKWVFWHRPIQAH